MYWGDYLRDTRDLTTLQHGAYLLLIAHYWQHGGLPANEKQLAAIVGLSVYKWRAIRDPIAVKFSDGWTHKRIDRELAKFVRVMNQKVIAGRSGGLKSGITRSALKGLKISKAAASLPLKRNASENEATGQAKTKQPGTNHQVSLTTTTEYVERGSVDNSEQADRKRSTEEAIQRMRSRKT
jgi:uncharacterized protein YdaU (DUF1376 family)